MSWPTAQINGGLIRQLEVGAVFFDFFPQRGRNTCYIIPHCQLKPVLTEALAVFYRVLDHFTLAQVTARSASLHTLLAFGEPA